MLKRAREGQEVPVWFDFGRAVLVRAAHETEHATTGTDAKQDAKKLAASRAADDKHLGAARAAFGKELESDGAFSTIAANAGLSLADAEVLALLAAAESDRHCERLVAAIQGDARANRLTLGTIAGAFGADHLGPLALGPDAPLRRAALVTVVTSGPWADHVVELHPGVVWALVGDVAADPDLPLDVEYHQHESRASDSPTHDLIVVSGPDRMRRRFLGAERAHGDRFICTKIVEGTSDDVWPALVREATITGRGVIVDVDDSLPVAGRRWIHKARHLSWVVSAVHAPQVDQMPPRPWIDVAAESAEPTDDEWSDALGDDTARTHRLTFDQLHRVARARRATGGDLDAAVRRLASGRLEQLTRRIRPTRTWDDIVLSPDRLAALQSIVDRYQQAARVYDDWGFAATPSRGIVALFSGPSGTGKTLASEIIAGALGLDVFKLDLSSVVSKYIGETEKNLEQIFDAASAANMVLFFDEADSLFGKRSEVKDARDRYANIEVSYLLQRLETYDGVVVMATNFEKNVDEAFLRRIHTRVAFDLPGVEERAAIWRQNLPASAPTDDIDVDWLAERFELSGGTIRNATVQAAFAAAAAGEPVTMRAAVLGVASELRKMGRLLRADDFGEHYGLVDE